MRSTIYGLAFVLVATTPGCQQGPVVVPVEGQVTVDGNPPPAGGMIYFTTNDGRPGTATFGSDGRFVAKSLPGRDGLLPGTYALGFECWETEPEMGGPPPVSYIRPQYSAAATSGFSLIVEPDEEYRNLVYDLQAR